MIANHLALQWKHNLSLSPSNGFFTEMLEYGEWISPDAFMILLVCKAWFERFNDLNYYHVNLMESPETPLRPIKTYQHHPLITLMEHVVNDYHDTYARVRFKRCESIPRCADLESLDFNVIEMHKDDPMIVGKEIEPHPLLFVSFYNVSVWNHCIIWCKDELTGKSRIYYQEPMNLKFWRILTNVFGADMLYSSGAFWKKAKMAYKSQKRSKDERICVF